MRKNIAIAVLFAAILAGGYYFFLLPRLDQNNSAETVPEDLGWTFPSSLIKLPSAGTPSKYSSIPATGGAPQGLPVRLQIPIIKVDSAIEDALITPNGQMAVPAGTVDVAWFALGPHPGQVGSAVIGGHFGIQNGVPFVFYDLSKLKVGNMIYIINDEGKTLAFVVRSISLFAANADATPVFTSTDGLAHLNLITCEGLWNEVSGNYPDRTVVFTDEVPFTGVAPATMLSVSTFPRALSIGESGADVSALQTALEQEGFLTMPPTVATGYFGVLTAAAVSKYQTSVGLPAVGVFGTTTRAKLISELSTNSVLPDTGLAKASPFLQMLGEYFESLYATPLDALISLFLLVAIIFMIVKIIRRKR